MRMLIVDDSEMVRDLYVRIIGPECEVIYQAADGTSALALLRGCLAEGTPLPDIIVSDYDMAPGMCGDEFAIELSKIPKLAVIPFLLSSANPRIHMIAHRINAHFFEKRGSIVAIRHVIRGLVAAAHRGAMAEAM